MSNVSCQRLALGFPLLFYLEIPNSFLFLLKNSSCCKDCVEQTENVHQPLSVPVKVICVRKEWVPREILTGCMEKTF